MTPTATTSARMTSRGPTIDDVQVDVFRFPTPGPEADGTLEWDATTAVTVRVRRPGRARRATQPPLRRWDAATCPGRRCGTVVGTR